MSKSELRLYREAIGAAYTAMRPQPAIGRWRPEFDEPAAWMLTELIVGIAKRYAERSHRQ